MKAVKVLIFAVLAIVFLAAAPATGNGEPAKPALPLASCFKIVVSEQGMARISYEDLAAKADISALDPRKLNLYCGGKAIPILIEGEEDGKLDPGDGIIFYCGQSNPRSPVDVFWLKPLAEGETPLRYKQDDRMPDEKAQTIDVVETTVPLRDAMETGDANNPSGITISARTINTFQPVSLKMRIDSMDFIADGKTKAKLVLRLRRRQCGADYGVRWKAVLSAGPDEPLEFKETVRGLDWYLTCEIPQSLFQKTATGYGIKLSLSNDSGYPDDEIEGFVAAMFSVQSATLTFTERAWARNDQVIVRKASPGSNVIVEGFTKMDIRVFCPQDCTETRTEPLPSMSSPGGYFTARSGGPYIAVRDGAFIKPAVEPYEIESKSEKFPHHPDLRAGANAADYLIIAPSAFMGAVKPLAEYRALPRRDGEKFSVMVVDAQEIYDQFAFGRFGPKPIKDFLEYARKNWEHAPRYVLLAADADRDTDFAAPGRTIPACQFETWFSGISGTDNWYATWGADGMPEFAIGRLPADSPEELRVMIDKIIAYETKSDSGPWRRKLDVVGGETRMGPEVEALLQKMFRLIFGGMMPRAFDLEVCYAGASSAYYYPAREFQKHFIESINNGALFFTYVGHGAVDSLDRVDSGAEQFPIFEHGDVAKLNCAGHCPIMFIVACASGAFDIHGQESLAEDMLKAPNAPVAVVASSGESHPYGNGILGIEMLPAFFANGGDCGPLTAPERASLGDMLTYLRLRNAQAKTVLRLTLDLAARQWVGSKAVERRLRVDHQYLYNLMGDPALQVAFPQYDVKLAADRDTAKPGEKITITGSCDGVKDGSALITLECDISEMLYPQGAPVAGDKAIIENYRKSNDKVVLSQQVALADGKFSIDLEIPKVVEKTGNALKPGTYYIKAYVAGEKGDAFAATAITVISAEAQPAP